jgi:hypothetical protein
VLHVLVLAERAVLAPVKALELDQPADDQADREGDGKQGRVQAPARAAAA